MIDDKQSISEEMGEKVIEQTSEKKHKGFTSKLGFILAAAGSAVGLGNLWRFPYLAAKYGGGIFLLCYIALAVTIGFTLLVLEISIGRKTGKGVIGAFASLNKKFKWFGFVCVVVPIMIVPYYCVIGGWVFKYISAYVVGAQGISSATFFTDFITSTWEPLVFFLVFALITIVVVAFGVQKGIEKLSKILMPTLAVIAVFLMIYVLCQPGAFEGVAYFLIPDFAEFGFETVLAALGQLFYSMSLAMCIMITYGSYMKKDVNIRKSARQISVCDTGFAVVSALIIIPAIFAFSPNPSDALSKSGPSLMFVQLPKVFASLPAGNFIGAIFFLLVFFAALTSSISLVEAIVAVLCEDGRMKRVTACIIVFAVILILGTLSSLGNGVLSGITITIKGEPYGILDIFDFVSNSVLMPIVAIITCIFAGYFIDKNILPKEIGNDNENGSRKYFSIMIRYVAPVLLAAILFSGLFLNL